MSIRYLSAKLAQQIDEELMNSAGSFSLDQESWLCVHLESDLDSYISLKQLMELAGLACAQTLATVYDKDRYSRVLVCCGPGNQGGDGLVAARHLSMFGYKPTLWMPKPGLKDIYKRLHTQCTNMDILTLQASSDPSVVDNTLRRALSDHDIILDAIFGFSFKPPVRAPFDTALPLLSISGLPIVSVDIPSGWDVEKGNAEGIGLNPDVLISLTAPKEGVTGFKGRHFLGGRFVPKSMAEKHKLNLPQYPGFAQIVELPQTPEGPGRL